MNMLQERKRLDMKVEFFVNTEINDGRQIFIEASEFINAKKDNEEFYRKYICQIIIV